MERVDIVTLDEDFSAKWAGLNRQILLDVYTVHKCFRYSFRQRTDYPLSEFVKNAVDADANIFGSIGVSEFVKSNILQEKAQKLSLYPTWLADDDVFSTIPLFYGMTHFVRKIKKIPRNKVSKVVISVVPQSIVSLYDKSREFQMKFGSLTQYLSEHQVADISRRLVDSSLHNALDIGQIFNELYLLLPRREDATNIIVLVDRRRHTETEDFMDSKNEQEFVMFQSAGLELLEGFKSSNCIGFEFEMNEKQTVKAYLHYGVHQRIRFYPEFMVSFVPTLFVTPSDAKMSEMLEKLYSPEYKHGWNINLDDTPFTMIYKAITGFDHETNNYYRSPKNENQDDEDVVEVGRGFYEAVVKRIGDKCQNEMINLCTYLQHQRYDSDAFLEDIDTIHSDHITKRMDSNISTIIQNYGFEFSSLLKDSHFKWTRMDCVVHDSVMVVVEDDDPQKPESQKSYEFGPENKDRTFTTSVIRWLPFGVEPDFDTLNEEIVRNEDSTVDAELYQRYQMLCTDKMEQLQFEDYTLDEMMALKLYTDEWRHSSKLRRAYLESVELETRKRFYHWARAIYLVSLRFAVPVQRVLDQLSGWILYTGVRLPVGQASALHFGPLFTTKSENVANDFGNIINIHSISFDPMRRCLALEMQQISCFKHEQEVLLVDQPIPIQNVNVKYCSDHWRIDRLMLSLRERDTPIKDRKLFFQRIGLLDGYKDSWTEQVTEHPLIQSTSRYANKSVSQRLVEELGVDIRLVGWHHVASCVQHLMGSHLSSKMKAVIDELTRSESFKLYDLEPESVAYFINALQETVKLTNMEVRFIENLATKAAGDGDFIRVPNQPAWDKEMITRVLSDKMCIKTQVSCDSYPLVQFHWICHDDARNAFIHESSRNDLDPQCLLDVYAVHKCHRFTFGQMADYPLSEFIQNMKAADETIWNGTDSSRLVNSPEFGNVAGDLSLYQSWLVKDDLFSNMQLLYGTTHFVQSLLSDSRTDIGSVNLVVIPEALVSVYDDNVQKETYLPIQYLSAWTRSCGVTQLTRRSVESKLGSAEQIGTLLQNLYGNYSKSFLVPTHVFILVDRRNCTETLQQEIILFECADRISLGFFRRNRCIGLDIEMTSTQNARSDVVVRAYLNFGLRQRIRMYPEFMVSVLPKLFVAPKHMTELEIVNKLYSPEFKHGWNVNLHDEHFNDIYKAITGYNHETNNYYRASGNEQKADQIKPDIGLFDHLDNRIGDGEATVMSQLNVYLMRQQYDSDAVIVDLFADRASFLADDSNIANFMRSVGAKESIDRFKKEVEDWKPIECGDEYILSVFDCGVLNRLVAVLLKFQKFGCQLTDENEEDFHLGQVIRDFDHLVSVHDLFNAKNTATIQRYIAGKITCDGGAQCPAVDHFQSRQRNDEKYKKLTDGMSTKKSALTQSICNVHCYLLHRRSELYRISPDGDNKSSRFASEIKKKEINEEQKEDEKEDVPLSIDFGISVLQWLPYGEKPLFDSLRAEMIENKDVEVSDYDEMEIVCAEKIENSDYSLNPYWTTDVLIFNLLNMDRNTGEIGPMNGISLADIHMDL